MRQPTGRSRWQAILAIVVALVVMDGQAATATYAESDATAHAAEIAQTESTPGIDRTAAAVSTATSPASGESLKADTRPDFRVAFVEVQDGRVGEPVSYTIEIRNQGLGGGTAVVSTLVPPSLSNVRVNASGFACTRSFAASGSQAGTLVTCSRKDLTAGSSADLTIGAQSPNEAASYQLSATADPRDDVSESDESNNEAPATLRVKS